jgi:type III restriction enzyme
LSRHVAAIAGRLSLRPPQRDALEILDRICEMVQPKKGADPAAMLTAIRGSFSSVADFEREFPSLCFALATGVGKTRLMGAFIAYLHLARGIRNFFVLAPNLTIYRKLIADFTPNTPKYVFKGIAEFAANCPEIITGDNYEGRARTLFDEFIRCKVNIFNISKISAEVRGGKSPRIKRLSEYIGESYFDYLAELPDLVVLMDESHRYRASAGVRAINELKPILGLELTATPVVETSKGATRFKNVVLDYPLGRAIEDGFVKEPAVVTRKDFNAAGMAAEQLERLKLEDGLRLHERTKVELETYARESGQAVVKPFLLAIARDTTHAGGLVELVKRDDFFGGRYRDKVIQVDSSRTGAAEEEMVERLLKVEHADEPTEIVIHVNMLKEGWDVTNLYTIVPLRPANARVLVEQSIGRGLRLPYGRRTGVSAVDRLSIVAHDRFQEIVDDASKPDSPVRVQAVVVSGDELEQGARAIVAPSLVDVRLGVRRRETGSTIEVATGGVSAAFDSATERAIAEFVRDRIFELAANAIAVPSVSSLDRREIQEQLTRDAEEFFRPHQIEMDEIARRPDTARIVKETSQIVRDGTIDIPRVLVVPRGEVRTGYRPFLLDLRALSLQPPSEEIWIQYLRTGANEVVGLDSRGIEEDRLEDFVVRGLIDFDDVAYDDHADLLYDLAGQTVAHFRSYLSDDETRRVLQFHEREVARFIHAQMQEHYSEEAEGYDVQVSKGFVPIKESAYTAVGGEAMLDFRRPPPDKASIAKHVFSSFHRCLHAAAKFQSDTERVMAVILDRESLRWFRPARGQFQITYRVGPTEGEYQPDFVAETGGTIYMVETKKRSDLDDADVIAKKEAAIEWCKHASAHAATYGGKSWIYSLIPHDLVAENMTLDGLVRSSWR